MTEPGRRHDSAPDGDLIAMAVPGDVAYVSTVRLTAASLAARCDLTIDDIEDLRLAVDEACALLLPHAHAGSALQADFVVAPGWLQVAASVHTRESGQLDRSGYGWRVLDALASSVEVSNDDGKLIITLTKRREAA